MQHQWGWKGERTLDLKTWSNELKFEISQWSPACFLLKWTTSKSVEQPPPTIAPVNIARFLFLISSRNGSSQFALKRDRFRAEETVDISDWSIKLVYEGVKTRKARKLYHNASGWPRGMKSFPRSSRSSIATGIWRLSSRSSSAISKPAPSFSSISAAWYSRSNDLPRKSSFLDFFVQFACAKAFLSRGEPRVIVSEYQVQKWHLWKT